MSSTFVRQVDGNHYGGHSNQHWDLMSKYDIEYLPGNASAYIMRWDLKGTPLKDLNKAISYLEKQLLVAPPGVGCRRLVPYDAMFEFWRDNDLLGTDHIRSEKRLLLELIHVQGSPDALVSAVKALEYIMRRERDAT